MGPKLSTDAELAHLPADAQALIRDTETALLGRYRYFTEQYSHSEKSEGGSVTHYSKSGSIMENPIHYFFNLTYASWLVLPRLSLQEMSPDWQARFIALLEEGYENGLDGPENIYVTRRGKSGLFLTNGEWDNYRHGTVQQAKEQDARLGA